MTIYVAVRHGSNSANQSMCNRAVLFLVDAQDKRVAHSLVMEIETFYNNQRLELIPQSKASKADYMEALEGGPWDGPLSCANVRAIIEKIRCY